MELLVASGGRGEGEAHVVIRQMVARALSDLLAAMHLARHGYLSQSYSAVRTAYETLDLAQLVITDPEEAEKWVNTEEGHKDFAPRAVRKRLGRPSFDEMYSHYSELAHPRFQGSRFNIFGKREKGNERLQVMVTVGPTMLDEFPDFWFLIMSIVLTTARLMLASAGLIGMGEVTEGKWDGGPPLKKTDSEGKPRWPTFKKRVMWLTDCGVIPRASLARWEAFVELRNEGSHATFRHLVMPIDASRTLALLAEKINDLFG